MSATRAPKAGTVGILSPRGLFDMEPRVLAHEGHRVQVTQPYGCPKNGTMAGALISRLNNDVLGAQQAFTDTFNSVIGNAISVGVTLVAMSILSWKITILALLMLPVFIFPARWVGGAWPPSPARPIRSTPR